jgi:hypothetical protein
MIRLTLPRRIPSGNKSTFGSRWAYMKERDAWFILLRSALTPQNPPDHRVKVHIVSYRKSLCDRINFAHGAKCILDGLVKLGYLKDDNETWLDDTYAQVKAKAADERTVITIGAAS